MGHLISDEDYREEMENCCAHAIIPDYNLKDFYGHEALCDDLQEIHDQMGIRDWEGAWKNLAESYDLVYSADVLGRLPNNNNVQLQESNLGS
jgi:hypothetical protein